MRSWRRLPRSSRDRIGAKGEVIAARTLEAAGFSIIARNWQCAAGELDLVARRQDLIVFAEVRTVTSDFVGSPAVTVDAGKQGRIERAARRYLGTLEDAGDLTIRFDVFGVRLLGSQPELDWIENAFTARSGF